MSPIHRKLILILTVVVVCVSGLSGCSSAVHIVKPDARASSIPPPDFSEFQIPIQAPVNGIMQQLEKNVPLLFDARESWTETGNSPLGPIGIKYRIERDPFRLSASTHAFEIEGMIRYELQVGHRIRSGLLFGGYTWIDLGSCGRNEPMREATIGLTVGISLDSALVLRSNTVLRPIAYANRCEMTALKLDVTGKIDDLFRRTLSAAAESLDARIPRITNIWIITEQTWRQLQQPIEIDSALWLAIRPRQLRVGPLTGSAQGLSTFIGLTSQPVVIFGQKPPEESGPIPAIDTARRADGFRITLDGTLPYGEASKLLTERLRKKERSVLGHSVQITSAQMYAGGREIVIQLNVTGGIDGTIYLSGKPVYDVNANVISVEDLDYTIDTRNVLTKAGDWLLHETFRSDIAAEARWELSDQLNRAKRKLQESLNRRLNESLVMVGEVRSIRPVAVYCTDQDLRARIVAEGNARIELR